MNTNDGTSTDTVDDTYVVTTHVERHWNRLFVQFHADLFLGFGNTRDTSFLTLECTRDNLDDATDFDTGGNSLWLEVWEDVHERRLTRENLLCVLEWCLRNSTSCSWVSATGTTDQLLDVVKGTGFDKDVATHVVWVKYGENFTLKRSQ